MYWDINRALSYNCLFNFIVGARGVGKTYGCKNWAIKDFLKTGGQFVYVRRFKTELKKTDKFFDDIIDSYPSVDFYAKTAGLELTGKIAVLPYRYLPEKLKIRSVSPRK